MDIKILLYEPNDLIRENILKICIQQGFKTKAITQKIEILGYFLNGDYQLLIMDYSATEPDFLAILQKIKSNKISIGKNIFIHSRTTEKNKLIPLIKLGVNGIILKPFIDTVFKKALFSLFKKNKLDIEKRKHIRVVPAPKEKALALIRHPKSTQVINCNIINISFGGIAVLPGDTSLLTLYKQGVTIPGIRFSVADLKIRADAKVMAITEKLLGLALVGLSTELENKLSLYICGKILFKKSLLEKKDEETEETMKPEVNQVDDVDSSNKNNNLEKSEPSDYLPLDHNGNVRKD